MARSFALLLMTAALAGAIGCGRKSPPPDVVLITIDTLRADHLGCYGYEKPTSPHIDQLAREGLRYDQCQSAVPITLPSHTTILTGLLPPEHGVRNNGTYRLPDGVPTLGEVLRDHGYHTGAFVSAMPVTSRFGLDRGFDVYDDDLPVNPATVFHFQARAGVDAVNAAVAWIDSLDDERPMFVWVHLFEPHMPYEPPPPFDAQFEGDPYDGEIATADAAVGQLLHRLASRGDRPRLTVLTADHGEGLGEHGEDTHGMFLYQTTLRVPLILDWPGRIPAGKVEEEPVGLMDVAPTILHLAGIDPQALHATGIALDPKTSPPRRRLYSESLYALETYQWSPMFALREGSHEVIRSAIDRAYDLDADPSEHDDLLGKDEAPWAEELRADLEHRVRTLAPKGSDASHTPTASEAQALASLGYVSSSQSPETDLLQLTQELPDATASLGDVRVLQRAEIQVTSGHAADAIGPLRAMLSRTPDNVWANVVLGRALAETEQYDAARQCYERAASLRPGWFEVLQNLGRLAAATGKPDEATRSYEQALHIDGTQTALWLEAAGVPQHQGQLDAAVAMLEKALAEPKLDAGPGPIQDALARVLLQADRVEEGRVHLEAARAAQPNDSRTIVLEALYLQRERRWQDMVDLLDHPQGALAKSGEAWLYLGVAQLMLGQSPVALESFRAALALDGSLHLAHNDLAWILATEQNKAEEALPHARRAIQLQPNEPEYHDTYLEVLERLGRLDEAKAHLAAVLGRFPHHAGLHQRAVRYGLAK